MFIAIYKDNILPVVNELAINKTFKILQQEVLNLEIVEHLEDCIMQDSYFKIQKRSMAKTATPNDILK